MFLHAILNKKTENEQDKDNIKNKWVTYNNTSIRGGHCARKINNKQQKALTYTHMFFDEFKLQTYLNKQDKNLLQLGVGTGKYIYEKQKEGWSVRGYEYTSVAVDHLKKNNIPHRAIDLNDIDNTGAALSYHKLLAKDLEKPVNVLAIRILSYLKPETICLLIPDLMNLAQANTVFFIVDYNDESDDADNTLKYNYFASFFGARTDMKFLMNKTTYENKQVHPEDHLDQAIVVKKI